MSGMIEPALKPPTQPRTVGPLRRGRVQKRSLGLTRVDKDGDLDMDAAGAAKTARDGGRRGNATVSQPRGGRTSGAGHQLRGSRQSRNGFNHDAVQRSVLRSMGMVTGDKLFQASKHNTRITAHDRKSLLREHDSSAKAGSAQVIIRGFKESKAAANPDGGIKDLLAFLLRKTTPSEGDARDMVRINKSRVDGDALIVSVRVSDVPKLTRLQGFTFAGAALSIEPLLGENKETSSSAHARIASSLPANGVSETLKGFLCRRYDPTLRLLDLSHLGTDSELVNLGIFDSPTRKTKLFPALMKVCGSIFQTAKEKAEGVLSVSLKGNNLDTIATVTTLAQTFPALKNLDLSDNQLKSLSAIEGWRWKFGSLEELILSGNPLEIEVPTYKDQLLRWYPTLRILNGVMVRTPEELSAASQRRAISIPILGPNFRDESGIGEAFVRHFFPGYDFDRTNLLNTFYDSQSTFSLSINVSAPRGLESAAKKVPNWENYIKRSRNLLKVQHPSARTNRIYTGKEMIRECWDSLPLTRHPDLADSQKWCIECNSIPCLPDPSANALGNLSGLILIIHGEFSEINVATGELTHNRSFDRTIVLGPGIDISVRVVCDTLMLRAWGGSSAWEPTAVGSALISTSSVPPPQEQPLLQNHMPPGTGVPAVGKTEEELQKELLVIEVSKRTGLKLDWSYECLTQSGWTLDGAVAAFENVKEALQPEAFLAYSTL